MSVQLIRCSSLDPLFACTPSVIDPQGLVRVKATGQEAVLGKIVHSLAASFIKTGRFDIKAEANRNDWQDEDEIARLMNYVLTAWGELERYFPKPQPEKPVKSGELEASTGAYRIVGAADVVSGVKDTDAVFADWKSGYIDSGYQNQMAGYAYCVWNMLGRPAETDITGIVVFLRHRYYRVVKYTAEKLAEWEYDLTHNVLARRDTYQPNKQCVYCPIYHACEARKAVVQGTVQALALPNTLPATDPHRQFIEKATALLASITPENKDTPEVRELMSQFRFRIKLVEKCLEDTKALIQDTVKRVGPLPLDNGNTLAMRETLMRSIDPTKAMKVLRQHLSEAEILACAKLSLPSLLAKKAAKFMRGEKKAAREQLEQDLDAAGAVAVVSRPRLEEVEPGMEQSNESE